MAKLVTFLDKTILISEGQKYQIGRSSAKGRQVSAPDNLFFDSPVISRAHGTLFMAGGSLYLTDNSSTHGSRYKASELSGVTKLVDGTAQLLTDKCVLHLGIDVQRETGEAILVSILITDVHKSVSGTLRIKDAPITPPKEGSFKRMSYGLSDMEVCSDSDGMADKDVLAFDLTQRPIESDERPDDSVSLSGAQDVTIVIDDSDADDEQHEHATSLKEPTCLVGLRAPQNQDTQVPVGTRGLILEEELENQISGAKSGEDLISSQTSPAAPELEVPETELEELSDADILQSADSFAKQSCFDECAEATGSNSATNAPLPAQSISVASENKLETRLSLQPEDSPVDVVDNEHKVAHVAEYIYEEHENIDSSNRAANEPLVEIEECDLIGSCDDTSYSEQSDCSDYSDWSDYPGAPGLAEYDEDCDEDSLFSEFGENAGKEDEQGSEEIDTYDFDGASEHEADEEDEILDWLKAYKSAIVDTDLARYLHSPDLPPSIPSHGGQVLDSPQLGAEKNLDIHSTHVDKHDVAIRNELEDIKRQLTAITDQICLREVSSQGQAEEVLLEGVPSSELSTAHMVANAQAQVDAARLGTQKRKRSDCDEEAVGKRIKTHVEAASWTGQIKPVALGIMIGAGLTFGGLSQLGSYI